MAAKLTSRQVWRYDPLAGLSVRAARSLYDAARGAGSPMLQRAYAEVEAVDPVLMTCVERRAAALAGLGWRVSPAPGADAGLAAEQRGAASAMLDAIGNLDEAVGHLDLAFFRGYSHVQPVWGADGAIGEISLLDSWNFLRAPDGAWLWNPECSMSPEGLETVEGARLVSVARPRAIDWPALVIHLRMAVGERDWGRFVERYGIPPVDAVMAPDATDEQRADYLKAAEDARDGLPVVWPSGTVPSRAEGARGQDPFSAFIGHQQKLVVLMATGGTLTSLAEAGSGTLAGNAQMDVWTEIVQRDAALIGAAFHRALVGPWLAMKFPGRPCAVRFELGREDEPEAGELFELAAKARSAGYRIEKSQLEEGSGYSLVDDAPAERMQGGFGMGAPFANSAAAPAAEAPAEKGAEGGLLESFARDVGPAAERVRRLLALVEAGDPAARDEAERLVGDLPGLIPGDPAMAAVLEEELARSFAEGLEEAGGERVENAGGECRAKDPAHCPTHGTPKTKAEEKRKRKQENLSRGSRMMGTVEKGGDVENFMTSSKLGRIAFYQGDSEEGYLHIKGNPDESHQAMLRDDNIPKTLSYGKYYVDPNGGWVVVGDGGKCVVLGRDGDGVKIITAYIAKEKAASFMRRGGQIENRSEDAVDATY